MVYQKRNIKKYVNDIIVISDGSSDNTVNIWLSLDEIFIEQVARNKGAEAAEIK